MLLVKTRGVHNTAYPTDKVMVTTPKKVTIFGRQTVAINTGMAIEFPKVLKSQMYGWNSMLHPITEIPLLMMNSAMLFGSDEEVIVTLHNTGERKIELEAGDEIGLVTFITANYAHMLS